MTDAVAAALEAARANTAAAVAATPAVAPVAQAAAVAPLGAGRVRSLADMAETYVERAELFLKVNENGMLVGDDVGFIDELIGKLKLSEVKFPQVCRYSVAGSHKYLRTYDGVREVTSGNGWGVAIAQAQQVDPKADVYDAVEIAIITTEEPKKTALKKDAELTPVPVGSRVGYTSSKTGFDPIMKTIVAAIKRIGNADAEISVKAFHIAKAKGQNKWGVVGLEELAN